MYLPEPLLLVFKRLLLLLLSLLLSVLPIRHRKCSGSGWCYAQRTCSDFFGCSRDCNIVISWIFLVSKSLNNCATYRRSLTMNPQLPFTTIYYSRQHYWSNYNINIGPDSNCHAQVLTTMVYLILNWKLVFLGPEHKAMFAVRTIEMQAFVITSCKKTSCRDQ